MQPVVSVIIRNRDGIKFSGECRSVSSYNALGKFDILARHANLISLIQKEIILVTKAGERRSIPLEAGLCRVKDNQVEIFLGVKRVG